MLTISSTVVATRLQPTYAIAMRQMLGGMQPTNHMNSSSLYRAWRFGNRYIGSSKMSVQCSRAMPSYSVRGNGPCTWLWLFYSKNIVQGAKNLFVMVFRSDSICLVRQRSVKIIDDKIDDNLLLEK